MNNVADCYRALPAAKHPWLQTLREQALSAFEHVGLPTHKTEAWKYLRLSTLREQAFDLVTPSALQLEQIQAFLLDGCYRLVIVNGFWDKNLSLLPPHSKVQAVATLLSEADAELRCEFETVDLSQSLLALNTALCSDGIALDIDGVIDQPLQLLFISDAQAAAQTSQQRHRIRVHAGASVELIEQYVSLTPEVHFINAVWHVTLAEHAQVLWQQVVNHQAQTIHFSHYEVTQQQHSRLDVLSFIWGGHIVRSDFSQRFCGEYASCTMKGLTSTQSQQQVDQHLTLRHAVGHCHSEQTFKGLATDHSRVIFNGKVVVDKNAQKTDAQQHHQNLLLSRTAEIYTKPELEIYADDVKCAHGATVGQLSDEALFYLKARGIAAAEARRLLIYAFGQEMISEIRFAPLQTLVGTLFSGHL